MITLITGIPGMGKTSLLIQMLMEIEKQAERPLFVMGIPDLRLEHNVAPPVEDWTELRTSPEDENLKLAYFTFPPNSILVVDEAQRVFRPRASASKVPDYVAALETHRHTGLDIILLTQKPKLIDTNVRELVGRYIHIRAGLLGRWLYEWPHIADGESRIDRSEAVKRKFKPPKQAFSKYKSAEAHTKHKFRVHQVWYWLVIVIGFTAWKGWTLYDSVTSRTQQAEQTDAAPSMARQPSAGALPLQLAPKSILEALTPADAHNPLSAPLYAAVAPQPVAPQIEGCISNRARCTCYSQQQTPIWLPEEQCRQRAAGEYYDPYRQPPPAPVGPTQHAQGSITPVQPVDVSKEKGAEAPLS